MTQGGEWRGNNSTVDERRFGRALQVVFLVLERVTWKFCIWGERVVLGTTKMKYYKAYDKLHLKALCYNHQEQASVHLPVGKINVFASYNKQLFMFFVLPLSDFCFILFSQSTLISKYLGRWSVSCTHKKAVGFKSWSWTQTTHSRPYLLKT